MEGDYANVVLTGLTQTDGAENPSGILEDAYLLVVSDMATIAVPTANPLTPGALIQITENHVMAAGKAPIPVFTMFEKSEFNSPLTGEMLSMMFLPALTFFLPQPNNNNAATFSTLKNCRFIVLFNRTIGGDFVQIGAKGLYAKIKSGSVSFGKGPSGAPGVTFVLEAASIHPFYDYAGTLPAPAA